MWEAGAVTIGSQVEQETVDNTEGSKPDLQEAEVPLLFVCLKAQPSLEFSFTPTYKLSLSLSFCFSHFTTNFLSHWNQKF